MRVVIVGAGLGGLSAACHLARRHEVTVLERAAVPGGRAGLLEKGGYRFDTGPTVLTMTAILEEAFAAAGTSLRSHVRLHPLDPMYRAVFADGSELRVRPGREAMTEEIRRFAGGRDADRFGAFCDWLSELYSVEMPGFIDRNFDSVLDLARPLAPALRLVRLGGFRKLHRLVARSFDDPRLQRIFSFQAMYAGLSPYEALGAYAVITYMDTVAGVSFPEGGMHAVSRGLAAAASGAGAELRYGAEVVRIVRAMNGAGPARGVELASGEVVAADAVVVNADVPVAYRELLADLPPPRAIRRATYSPSCFLWLAGVRGTLPPGVAHHNIHFGEQWKEAFDALLRDGVRMPDPSVLVTVPTVSDPALAPAPGPDGVPRHILYVLEPTPHLGGKIDWARERDRVHAELQGRVTAFGYPASVEQVEVADVNDPTDWERAGMAMGTPFALSHRFLQTGPFRPANVEKRVPGLVFVGSSTVPGVGVPMVLLSGKLAARRVEELSARRG